MALSYSIAPERELVVAVGSGELSGNDLLTHLSALPCDPHFNNHYSYMCDLSRVDSFRLSATSMQRVAQHMPFNRNARVVLVAPSHLASGMCRMLDEQLSNFLQHKMFSDRNDAYSWLTGAGVC